LVDSIEAIAVKLPEAERKEVEPGRTEVPLHAESRSKVQFYSRVSIGQEKRLALRYELKPTAGQALIRDSAGLDLLAGVLPPILAIVLVPGSKAKRPKARRVFLWITIGFELLVLGFFAWAVFHSPESERLKAVVKLGVVLCVAAAAGLATWIKGESN
jgi:hypothetical protein